MKRTKIAARALMAFFACVAGNASWATDLVSFGGASYHFERDLGYNEFNYGLGYERDLRDDFSISGGVFKNSIRRAAFYVLGNYYPVTLGAGFRLGLAIGGVSGYRHLAVAPALLPALEWRGERLALQTYVIPTIKPHIDGAVVLQVKYQLSK
ncbi:hypothetical protein [Uliginosibacterium gangwonense]|uniref:hypothetical protein n=1 Tax=Uliginosibacterium gangwonense TaxID=392736 RepID=UPI0012F83845|nr:hypothetical protein [Uliginosibacterium gangwonense]